MSTSLCLLNPGLFPAYQMTARKQELGICTGSGWDSAWLMSICPITQSCSACPVPNPTPSQTGPATSVSCRTGSPVTSAEQTTCRSSSSLTQPTLLSGVCRYCTAGPVLTFPKPKVFSPSWLLHSSLAPPPPHHHYIVRLSKSPAPGCWRGSSAKVIARGHGFKCYSLAKNSSASKTIPVLFFSES